jgi:hypothetical protein
MQPDRTNPIYTDRLVIRSLIFDNKMNVVILGLYVDIDSGRLRPFQARMGFEDYLPLIEGIPDPCDILLPSFGSDQRLCTHRISEFQHEPLELEGIIVLKPFDGPEEKKDGFSFRKRPTAFSCLNESLPCLTIAAYHPIRLPLPPLPATLASETTAETLLTKLKKIQLRFMSQYCQAIEESRAISA